MLTWPDARRVIVAEMERQGHTRRSLAVAAGLSPTTVYTACGQPVRGRVTEACDLDTVAALLAALGKGFAWLERKVTANRTLPVETGRAAG